MGLKSETTVFMCPDCYMPFHNVERLRQHQQRLCPDRLIPRIMTPPSFIIDKNQENRTRAAEIDQGRKARRQAELKSGLKALKLKQFLKMRKNQLDNFEQIHQVRLAEMKDRGQRLADRKIKIVSELENLGIYDGVRIGPPVSDSQSAAQIEADIQATTDEFYPRVEAAVASSSSKQVGFVDTSLFEPTRDLIAQQVLDTQLAQKNDMLKLKKTFRQIEKKTYGIPPTPPPIPPAWLPPSGETAPLSKDQQAEKSAELKSALKKKSSQNCSNDSMLLLASNTEDDYILDQIRALRKSYLQCRGSNDQILESISQLEREATRLNEATWQQRQQHQKMMVRRTTKVSNNNNTSISSYLTPRRRITAADLIPISTTQMNLEVGSLISENQRLIKELREKGNRRVIIEYAN